MNIGHILVIGKNHPSLYAFLSELKKEQANTEIGLRQIQLSLKIKKLQDPKSKWREEQIFNVVNSYPTYVANGNELNYLRNIGHNIPI